MNGPEKFIVWVGTILIAIVFTALVSTLLYCLYNIVRLVS